MITKEALDAIGAAIQLHAPDHEFLCLLSPMIGLPHFAVCSNLPRPGQAAMAFAFAKAYAELNGGGSYAKEAPRAN